MRTWVLGMDGRDAIDITGLIVIMLLGLAVRFSGWGRGIWPPRG